MLVIWSCVRINGEVSHEGNRFEPPVFCQLIVSRRFLCYSSSIFPASVVAFVAFVLLLFVPHFFFFRCLWKAVLHECGISHVYSIICLVSWKANRAQLFKTNDVVS